MNLLMLSSSRAGDEAYLAHAKDMIASHLTGCQRIVFIPYAGVTIDWPSYTEKVQSALPEFNIIGIESFDDPKLAIEQADAVMVGGGNTFHLLHQLYSNDLIHPIQERVEQGLPYVGWSAGSNICGTSICTTNDMPIIYPPSFDALAFVPFQLNPHYSDYQPPGHNGETRAQRIEEFCVLNPSVPVIGIKEGTALVRKNDTLTLQGQLAGVVFKGRQQNIIQTGEDLTEYLRPYP
ncbi:MAG: dipeptidase PepE [Paraglaciecola chathamensis]|uniref:dipeptidase PepE n=1 Tax=Paraglaciecola chathamensis TaxID=368405 RepID=UPI00270CA1BE|nr:dipeptidase PepE [Paraglaciecola chathamensis]MDO6840644.1 dipeptidase PepE [Paraglaciecola chathamensis]